MSHRLRPQSPSAADGYRRLARTRAAVGQVDPTATDPAAGTAELRRARRTVAARAIGALRLVGFVAVLAMIVGTSVSLASADPSDGARSSAAKPAATPRVEPRTTADEATDEATDDAPTPRATPAPAAAPAVATPRATTPADGSLPFTGTDDVERILLGGAVLVFLGMLVQIAGQPLPAARARATR